MATHISIDPNAIEAAAGELEALAGRIETAAALHRTALSIAPAGGEEVSALATQHFNRKATVFDPCARTAIAELRGAALTFRRQAAAYRGQDTDHAAGLAMAM